jgi:hypothetical protein
VVARGDSAPFASPSSCVATCGGEIATAAAASAAASTTAVDRRSLTALRAFAMAIAAALNLAAVETVQANAWSAAHAVMAAEQERREHTWPRRLFKTSAVTSPGRRAEADLLRFVKRAEFRTAEACNTSTSPGTLQEARAPNARARAGADGRARLGHHGAEKVTEPGSRTLAGVWPYGLWHEAHDCNHSALVKWLQNGCCSCRAAGR